MYGAKQVDSLLEVYNVIGSALLEHGDIVSPRGNETKELLGVSFCLTNPTNRSAFFPSRKFNKAFAISECLMLFLPYDQVGYFSHYNKNVEQFSDDGVSFYGAYGARIAEYIPAMIEKLESDPDTRQAALTIYNSIDGFEKTKDVPCTLSMHFMIREGKLNLHVTMRSNDIIWGLPYDVFNFTVLQEVIANTLGIPVGKYFHTVSSMHVYKHHYELLEQMLREIDSYEAYTDCFFIPKDFTHHFNMAIAYCKLIEIHELPTSKTKFIEWVQSC